jgi:hypothetical protein
LGTKFWAKHVPYVASAWIDQNDVPAGILLKEPLEVPLQGMGATNHQAGAKREGHGDKVVKITVPSFLNLLLMICQPRQLTLVGRLSFREGARDGSSTEVAVAWTIFQGRCGSFPEAGMPLSVP